MTEPIDPPIDVNCIIPGLWMGGKPQADVDYWDLGFSYVVLCSEEVLPLRPSFEWVMVSLLGLEDGPSAVAPAEFTRVVEAARTIREFVSAGRRVLVTCTDGLNRSGLVTGVALRLLEGWSGRKIVEHLQSRRFINGRHPFWNNPSFAKRLIKFGSRTRKKEREACSDHWF